MERYSISHVWKEEPDYDAMARSVLAFLLEANERASGESITPQPITDRKPTAEQHEEDEAA